MFAGLDPDVAHVIVKAGGSAPLVRRSAKGSTDVRVAALTVLRDIAKAGNSLVDSGPPPLLPQDEDISHPIIMSSALAQSKCSDGLLDA